jgi:hypothetical protein
VFFAGIRADVPRLMIAAMDRIVLPSKYEGLGICAVEGQTAGLPCVISDAVPEEADVVEGLVHRLPLSADPVEWARKLLSSESPVSREEAIRRVDESPFNLRKGVANLIREYQG